MDFTPKQKEIMETYIQVFQKYNSQPTISDLKEGGISKARIKHHFGNMEKLHDSVKEYDLEGRVYRFDDYIFDDEVQGKITQKIKKYKKFLVTTAIAGCPVDKKFLDSLDVYCKENKALLLILPVYDVNKNNSLDSILENRNILTSSVNLNSNIHINNLKISPRLIDPLSGLDRMGHRDYSFIYPSPKQRLRFIPNQKDKTPLAMMTTGSLTTPEYVNKTYKNQKSSYISKLDHIMGCVVVEVQSDEYFHFRQIQCDEKKGFYDKGLYYSPKKLLSRKPEAEAFVLGDYHSGQTSEIAEKNWIDVLKKIKVKTLVFHDIFNGLSINHHDKHQKLTLARRADANQLNLRNEIKKLAEDIAKFIPLVDNIVISKSNHDEFLTRYLEECRFQDDPQNLKYALELALAMANGLDPLKYAVEKHGVVFSEKVLWLKGDESYKILDVEVGEHGHRGAHGSYGSLRQFEKSYGKSVTAHTHVPEILRQSYRAGTSSDLDLEYNSGLSSWMWTSCLIFKNGSRQLINVIDKKWCL